MVDYSFRGPCGAFIWCRGGGEGYAKRIGEDGISACPNRPTGRGDFETPVYTDMVLVYHKLRVRFLWSTAFKCFKIKFWHPFLSTTRPFRLCQDTGSRGRGETGGARKDRPTFVLVHGLAGSTASWDEVG